MNAFFQATNADPDECMKELFYTTVYFAADYMLQMESYCQYPEIDFGVTFFQESSSLVSCTENKEMAKVKVNKMYSRCQSFLLEVSAKVEYRLPPKKIFNELSNLSRRCCLKLIEFLLPDFLCNI